ncbi:MAG: cytochrome c-type biosis protein CcmF, partial [Methylobacteriaceae bacterium]|jgi:cytochrome c-type biogenesis protein CcmF|nr:cytochrome c-type biosis protein CcmF [Methylobacteriaceae bacterium]
MIVESGHYALVLAFVLALFQAIVPLVGLRTGDAKLVQSARSIALAQFAFVAIAYAALTYAHVVSDFSLANVYENSHSAKPLVYKISGVWGNHEGSMLLWVLVLSICGASVALFSRIMPETLRAGALGVQGWIGAAFLLFVLATSNPFARFAEAPLEGRDLNPILQDPGLAIHPPLLYLGYVGFSVTFSFAAAALLIGRVDAGWARVVRPWVLAAWIFLTLGIAMGSYWAYYTLGWGGFWFWDPVENASLMPWLAGTALLHCMSVMQKRDALKIWTIFLAILAFSLSLLGTFLVRSGVLTSVHAFANDPARGVFILAILVLFIGGALILFAVRANALVPGGVFAPVSREGALVLNNLLLTCACATVFIGTLYPLALEAVTGEKISVGAPYFNLTFVPLALPLAFAMPFGQQLAWKRGNLLGAAQRLIIALACGFAASAALALTKGGPVLSVITAGLAIFLIVGSFADVVARSLRGRGHILYRAVGIPRSAYATSIAHAGIGLTLFGLASTGWGVEEIVRMQTGHAVAVGPYELVVTSVAPGKGPNFQETVAHTLVRGGGVTLAEMNPAQRFYPVRQMSRTEAGIATLGLGQIYMSLAEVNADGSIDARLYWKPFVVLIWIGALVMAAGGLLSLSDRRIGFAFVPRARRRIAPVSPQAAE